MKIEGVLSEIKLIECGVPQGGVLSPTLFSCFIKLSLLIFLRRDPEKSPLKPRQSPFHDLINKSSKLRYPKFQREYLHQ